MSATDLRRNAHVLVLQELRSRSTESGIPSRTAALDAAISALAAHQPVMEAFQSGVAEWMDQCFQQSLYSDMTERGDRLLEEVLELLQAHGYDSARVPTLVNYVFGRPVGEPAQEVGGVMVTLAAYCSVAGLNMQADGQAELERISQPEVMARIRAKQEAKNALHFDTPLPGDAAQPSPAGQGDALHDAVGRIFGCDGSPWRTRDVAEVLRDYAALAARQPVGQEPVAVVTSGDRFTYGKLNRDLPDGTPLYAAAPAQGVDHRAALLAEERAHGETIDQRDRYHEVADELAGHIAAITGVDIGEHSSANCPWQNAIEAAEAYQPAQAVEMSPEFTDTARAAIAWVLWHHQGCSSPVGQPLRYSLGMGQHDRMSDHQITEAKRFAALSGATTERFHHHKRAEGVDLTAVRVALDAAEGLAVACASVDCYSREEIAASGRAMKHQFADARALIDSQAVRNG